MTSMKAAIRFGVVSAVRRGAHQLGDYWVQTDHQAITKGEPGAAGAKAALGHVATYSLVSAAAVAVANKLFGLGLSVRGQVLGELISAGSHYAADRREHGLLFPLARRTGHNNFLERGGAPLLDQAWHDVFIVAAAGVTALDAD